MLPGTGFEPAVRRLFLVGHMFLECSADTEHCVSKAGMLTNIDHFGTLTGTEGYF